MVTERALVDYSIHGSSTAWLCENILEILLNFEEKNASFTLLILNVVFFGNEGCFEQTSAHETLEVSKVKTGLPSEEESSNPRPSPHPPLPGCHLDQPNLPQLQT